MADYVNLELELLAAIRNAAKLAEDVERYAKAAEKYRTERDEWHALARERAERIVKLCESRDSARTLRDEYHEAYHQAEAERNTLVRENAQLRSELAFAQESVALRGDALILRLAGIRPGPVEVTNWEECSDGQIHVGRYRVPGGRAMTGPDLAAAYRIAGDAVPHSTCDDCAEESTPAAVAALAAAGWLHDPAEVAALRRAIDALSTRADSHTDRASDWAKVYRALRALDADALDDAGSGAK